MSIISFAISKGCSTRTDAPQSEHILLVFSSYQISVQHTTSSPQYNKDGEMFSSFNFIPIDFVSIQVLLDNMYIIPKKNADPTYLNRWSQGVQEARPCMEHPLNPPPAQRALSLLSKSTHLCQKSADVRPHQQEHVAHTRQSLGTLLFAMLSLCLSIIEYRSERLILHSVRIHHTESFERPYNSYTFLVPSSYQD